MKRYLLIALVICSFLAFGSSAWSLTINGGTTEVGAQDDYVDGSAALLGNSGNAEQDWLTGLGFDPGEFNIYDTVAGDWEQTNADGIWALGLEDSPDFFFIKIGTGNLPEGTPDTYLFDNNPDLTFAVVDLADLNIESITNVGRISHIGEGPGTSVPEPGMLLLFGSGLLGLGLFGRKKFRK